MSPTVFLASDYILLSRLKGENHFKENWHTRNSNSHYISTKHAQTAKMNIVLFIHIFPSKLYFIIIIVGETVGFDLSHCDAAVVKSFGAKNEKGK